MEITTTQETQLSFLLAECERRKVIHLNYEKHFRILVVGGKASVVHATTLEPSYEIELINESLSFQEFVKEDISIAEATELVIETLSQGIIRSMLNYNIQ